MRIAALEGPSFAGKTSTLASLRSILPDLITYSCYVDQIANVDDIPPARTRSAEQQLEAFRLFMRVEAGRVADLAARAASGGLVLLDRSVDTLLAHAYALDQLYDFGVYDKVRALLVEMVYLRPNETFFLDANPEELRRRRRSLSGPFDSFLINPEFVSHFRQYFIRNGLQVSPKVSFVDAEQSQSTVAKNIAQMLS